MSDLIEPVVNRDCHQITNRGMRMSDEAIDFSRFLKTYMPNWPGTTLSPKPYPSRRGSARRAEA